jgi:hypothetical protein
VLVEISQLTYEYILKEAMQEIVGCRLSSSE